MGKSALPAHGTVRRYRLELKTASVCDRCRAANSQAKAKERADRKAREQRALMALVADPQEEPTSVGGVGGSEPEPGEMEKAVRADLAEITEEERVPFHRSLSALAMQLAREVDGATAATTRSAASRQLFDVLKSLRSRKDADVSTALDIVLEDFGVPLVPDGPA